MRASLTLTAAALLVVASATLGAQDRPPRQLPRPVPDGSATRPMAGNMPMHGGPPAAHMLMMRQALALSDDQVTRLETLAASQRAALEPDAGGMLRAAADLADAMKGEGNLGAARTAMDKLARIYIDQAIAHLKAMQETRVVLTAEQRDKVHGMMQAMIMQYLGRAGAGMMMPRGAGMRPPGGPPPGGHERP